MAASLQFNFVGGDVGPWMIERIEPVAGPSLPVAAKLAILAGRDSQIPIGSSWVLRGATGNVRYSSKDETASLRNKQEGLDRPSSVCAALIPVRKIDAWWELSQDERRQIIEERSHHIELGLKYLPAIARRLHHCRELGEPFDFLTWFEFAPDHSDRFEELLGLLRQTEEWSYVEREVDIRLRR